MATICINLKLLLFFIILLSFNTSRYSYGEENYIVTIVNKIPITKVDIVNRAKLISISIEKNNNIKNLDNYYNQSLKALINEKIVFSAGEKINKNLNSIITKEATKLLLSEFENSKIKLNKFIKKYSIPKEVLLEKYKAQIIWGIILRNKYKTQFSNIEKNIDKSLEENKKRNNEDLYELAEIVIYKKNNDKLLEKITSALKNDGNFLDIAKQVSISSSSKFNGKIGWSNFKDLPEFIKKKKKVIKEGDIFSFLENDKIKIIKILVKRLKGKLSYKEDMILLAQIKFPINFQKKDLAYKNMKSYLDNFFLNKRDCKSIKYLKEQDKKNIDFKVIKSRIADLSSKIQNTIKALNFFETSKPIFVGNDGYTFIKCDIRKARLNNIDYKKLKEKTMNKYFSIYSEKLIKRLNNEANISFIEKIK